MKLYDTLIDSILGILEKNDVRMLNNDVTWGINDKNIFLLDKETAYELGGYPKESVNIIIQSSSAFKADGVYVVAPKDININNIENLKHISFGKVVILKTKGVDENNIYDFTQKAIIKDSKMYFDKVMTRASSKHYFVNYKVSKAALKEGFNINKMAMSIYDAFKSLEEVEDCAVFLLVGDMDIYKELLPLAEKNKEISIALNHIFDGVNMDCKSCDMTEICDEIKELRSIHKKKQKG